jgi:CubicO group peptidase (beta-lactamase class C family)
VLGTGDGGIYSTAADLSAFWDSLFAGRIVSPEWVAEMVRPRSDWPEQPKRYGLGFHLHATGDGVWLEVRRRRVVRQPARALVIDHLHRHLELVTRRMADRGASRRPPRYMKTAPESAHSSDERRTRATTLPVGRSGVSASAPICAATSAAYSMNALNEVMFSPASTRLGECKKGCPPAWAYRSTRPRRIGKSASIRD